MLSRVLSVSLPGSFGSFVGSFLGSLLGLDRLRLQLKVTRILGSLLDSLLCFLLSILGLVLSLLGLVGQFLSLLGLLLFLLGSSIRSLLECFLYRVCSATTPIFRQLPERIA